MRCRDTLMTRITQRLQTEQSAGIKGSAGQMSLTQRERALQREHGTLRCRGNKIISCVWLLSLSLSCVRGTTVNAGGIKVETTPGFPMCCLFWLFRAHGCDFSKLLKGRGVQSGVPLLRFSLYSSSQTLYRVFKHQHLSPELEYGQRHRFKLRTERLYSVSSSDFRLHSQQILPCGENSVFLYHFSETPAFVRSL